MTKLNVYDLQGKITEEMEVSEDIFGLEPNHDLLHRAVVMQLANKRQGTSSTKTRSFVAGGGRKPYRQKGTGRARQGSIRSAQHVGGGVIFGPLPRSYRTNMNKKMRRLALKSALSAAVQDEKMKVVDQFNLAEVKTKVMAAALKALEAPKSTLIVTPVKDETVVRCAANIPGVQVEMVNTINVVDLLKYDHVIMTKDAVRKIEEVYES